jgi:mono/diheme cytochrome c family protein
MKTLFWAVGAGVLVSVVAGSALGSTRQGARGSAGVKRGEYLVTVGGCNDCHTPWKMGPRGPEQDLSRLLSGHPEGLAMPAAPQVSPPWGGVVAATFTAWAGPWGTSFTANLTPDPETGMGKWTEQNFIEAMRTGRHQGRGRPILPPMPWPNMAKMTDQDLKATFAYLQSIPPIRNRVPDPIPPSERAGAEQAAGAGAPERDTSTGSSSQGERGRANPPPGR